MPQHKQLPLPHEWFVRLLLVVHNTMYSYCTAAKPLFPKPRILLKRPEKQGLAFVSAFVLVSFKGTDDEKPKAYIAGKIFLIKVLEFQK